MAPDAPKRRFSSRVRLLQGLDRRLGAAACLALTLVRRAGNLLGGAPVPPAAPRSILFLKLAEQGSTVLAYEAVRRAVARVGREHVYFLVFEENRFVVDVLGLIPPENVFTVDTGTATALAGSALRTIRAIRRRRIEACVDLEFFARSSAAISYLTGATIRVGFHSKYGAGPYRGDLLTHRITYHPHQHTSATFTTLVEALSADPQELPALGFRVAPSEVPPLFRPEPAETEAMRALLATVGAEPGQRLILLNANAGDLLPLRKWAEENYVALARRLLAKHPGAVVAFTGAREEAPRVEALAAAVGSPRSVSVAGRTTLRELLALYGLSDLLVTNDSGPAHFAALTTVDVITLFGPETPHLFAALGPRSHSLWAGLACSPCVNAHNNRQTACRHNRCMQAISVDEVFVCANRILERRAAPASLHGSAV